MREIDIFFVIQPLMKSSRTILYRQDVGQHNNSVELINLPILGFKNARNKEKISGIQPIIILARTILSRQGVGQHITYSCVVNKFAMLKNPQ